MGSGEGGGGYNRRKKQGFQGCGEAINVAKKLNLCWKEKKERSRSSCDPWLVNQCRDVVNPSLDWIVGVQTKGNRCPSMVIVLEVLSI